MLLGLRTDGPEVTMVLVGETGDVLATTVWQADRQLAHQLLARLESFLAAEQARFSQLRGLFVYAGPGSFTGLRIGITTINTHAYSLGAPVVGVGGEDWVQTGVQRLATGENDAAVLPEYGAEARVTTPKR